MCGIAGGLAPDARGEEQCVLASVAERQSGKRAGPAGGALHQMTMASYALVTPVGSSGCSGRWLLMPRSG